MSTQQQSPSSGSSARTTGARVVILRYGLVIAVVWLAVQIITQGMSDHYLGTDPTAAILWRSDSADALTALAQARLAGRKAGAAARYARRALELSPLDVAALSLYATALDEEGQSRDAAAIMAIAGTRGWRDGLTQFWLFREYTLERRYAAAIDRADALLRRIDEKFDGLLFAVMARAVRDKNAIAPLTATLASNPPWRPAFLGYLEGDTQPLSGEVAYTLLLALKRSTALPTDQEIAGFLGSLVNRQKYRAAADAFRALSRSAPAPGEFVTDGGFDKVVGTSPFDWSLGEDVGWSTEISPAPGRERQQALRIDYDSYSSPAPLKQLVVLPEGDYRFTGRSYAESPEGAFRLAWAITCVGGDVPLVRVPTSSSPLGAWSAFAASFHVPSADCPAQWLELKADPGDVRQDVIVWYRSLSVIGKTAFLGGPIGSRSLHR